MQGRIADKDAALFHRVCRSVQDAAATAECRLAPALVLTGCSQANLEEYLSALHQRPSMVERPLLAAARAPRACTPRTLKPTRLFRAAPYYLLSRPWARQGGRVAAWTPKGG